MLGAVWSGFALFANATMSDTLVYEMFGIYHTRHLKKNGNETDGRHITHIFGTFSNIDLSRHLIHLMFFVIKWSLAVSWCRPFILSQERQTQSGEEW